MDLDDGEATRAIPTGTHPVTVGVISAGSGFCERLATARVLWGSDLPYGQTIARATRPDDPTLILLPLEEGIEPLLDIIRSRQIL